MCVSIKGDLNSQFLYNSLQFLWLNRTLCGITWQYTLLGKTENNSAEKVSLSLSFPSLLPETRKMETYEEES